MTPEDGRQALADAAGLWSVGGISPTAVIVLACDALAAGLDGQSLRELAGLPASPSTSLYDVEDLLAPALEGLGIPHFERGSAAGEIAAARVYATRCVGVKLGPRELAEWMHRTFQHGQNDMLERFLGLDDEYDILKYTGRSREQVDQSVVEACYQLLSTDRAETP